MEFYSNNSILFEKRTPLEAVITESTFLLRRVIEGREYVDGHWGDKVTGYTYECIELEDFRHLKIKIDGQNKPLMPDEELQALKKAGKKVFVEFANATILPYLSTKKTIEDSIKADDVRLVETEFEL